MQKTVSRRITVQASPGQKCETLSKKQPKAKRAEGIQKKTLKKEKTKQKMQEAFLRILSIK
jgi:hypothetical protein